MKVSSTGAATSARELRGPLTRPWAGGAQPRPVARAGWWGAGCGGARGGRWGVRAVVEGKGRYSRGGGGDGGGMARGGGASTFCGRTDLGRTDELLKGSQASAGTQGGQR